jgi:hypothetical protein
MYVGAAVLLEPMWLHVILYAAAVATTVYVVLDLDNPRVGLIRLDATERILHDLHDSIRQQHEPSGR